MKCIGDFNITMTSHYRVPNHRKPEGLLNSLFKLTAKKLYRFTGDNNFYLHNPNNVFYVLTVIDNILHQRHDIAFKDDVKKDK